MFIQTIPSATCPSWCDQEHEEAGSHSVEFLLDEEWTDTHGQVLSVSLQSARDDAGWLDLTEPWVETPKTLTVEMAERLIGALQTGLTHLRQANPAQYVILEGYPNGFGSGWVPARKHYPPR